MATNKKNPSAADEIRNLSDADLQKEVKELKVELFKLRFSLATGQLEATSEIKKTRKDIARRLTVLSERANGNN